MQEFSINQVKDTIAENSVGQSMVTSQNFLHYLFDVSFENSALGTGIARAQFVKPGITLTYVEQYYQKKTRLEIGNEGANVAFIFGVGGGADTKIFEYKDDLQFYEGHGYIMICPELSNFLFMPPGIHYKSLMVYVEKDHFIELVNPYLSELPPPVVKALEEDLGYLVRKI
ncbi:MAG TPA: hypothetical protein DCE41_22395, partial [Cytophagales bacterium]|nr:hypothetical protein [Cytophagales bacterium]